MQCCGLNLHKENYKYALHMKRQGSTSDFNEQRNAELRAAFFDTGLYSTSDEAMRRTVKTPASRFWVDPYRARDVISHIEKNPDTLDDMLPERRRMYGKLYERYKQLRLQHPDASKIQSVTMAVYSKAPEFFISPATARTILYMHPGSHSV